MRKDNNPDLFYCFCEEVYRGKNLHGEDLAGESFYNADFIGANLSDADLSNSICHGAMFCHADLTNADLECCDLRFADLRDAELYGTNLYRADYYGADLRGAKNIPELPMACPSAGSFIAWKTVVSRRDAKSADEVGYTEYDFVLAKLLIPEDAKRSSATTEKCRCSKVKVLAFEKFNGDPYPNDIAVNMRDNRTVYKVGETVSVVDFDEYRWNECSTGIHFFMNRIDAINYVS